MSYLDRMLHLAGQKGLQKKSVQKPKKQMINEANDASYDYSCLYVEAPDDIKQKVVALGKQIPDEDIYEIDNPEYGREEDSHITVKYGFHTPSAEDVKPFLKGIKGLTANIVDIDVFENDDFDVVILKITSSNMTELHNKLDKLSNSDEYPEYNPHMTIAYVKKGMGQKYKNMDIGDLERAPMVFGDVVFSSKDDSKVEMELDESLASARKTFLDTKKISQHDFDWIASMDTTPTKKYIHWLAQQWSVNDERFESREKAHEYLDLFTKLTNKNIIKQKDINSYKSLKDLVTIIDDNKGTVTKTQAKKDVSKDAEKVFENDQIVIIKPKSQAAACKYGKGTQWCISATTSENYFNKYYYNDNVTFYLVIKKQPENDKYDKNDKYNKTALAVYPGGNWDVYDLYDNNIDSDEFLDGMVDYTGLDAQQVLKLFPGIEGDKEDRQEKRKEIEATHEELREIMNEKMYDLAYEISDFESFKHDDYTDPAVEILAWIEENAPDGIIRDREEGIDIEDDAIESALEALPELYWTYDEVYLNTIEEIKDDIRLGNFDMDEDNYEFVDDEVNEHDVHSELVNTDSFTEIIDGVEQYDEESLGQALMTLGHMKQKHVLDLDKETLIDWIIKSTGGRYNPGQLVQLSLEQLQSMIDDIKQRQASQADPSQKEFSFESLDKKFDTMLLEAMSKKNKLI